MLNRQSPSAPIKFDALSLLHLELNEHRDTVKAMAQILGPPFLKTLEILKDGLQQGGKLMFFGNGDSAADAQHITAELIVRYKTDRV